MMIYLQQAGIPLERNHSVLSRGHIIEGQQAASWYMMSLHDKVCITHSLIAGTQPNLIYYSCTGFINARSWLKDVRDHADPHLTCILVGNKVDLVPAPEEAADRTSSDIPKEREPPSGTSRKKREVTIEEAELWAQEEGLLFVEASAKSGVNVEAAFERATRDILDKIRRGVFDDERVRLLPLIVSVKLNSADACILTVPGCKVVPAQNR